ncbi:hypothetical protein MMC13_008308 [Lambiella insularis]|nr:hypothetical protein [Lambiella insularis]
MSTSLAKHPPQATLAEGENGNWSTDDDPFTTGAGQEQRRLPHRYSSFDTQLFALNHSASSPSQAKRALEAHLTETDRRLHEASKLGTALVKQRKDLSDRLNEVERQKGEREIGPELRQKLIEVEKEYNEIGRDSARAFLGPRSRLQPTDEGANGFSTADYRRPPSPTKFSSQATDSPSKVNVPSRKQRNQPSNRVHDIEFATEISTSLLAQVRQLQALLVERDDSLKAVTLEKSRLEHEAEGFSQRLKSLDDSEQRYKDENWALETQTHELLAASKESADREQRLQQTLALAISEKSAAQRELDDIKQAHGKLAEDHATFRKTHEAELASLRRNVSTGESDRETLNQRIDELTSQNQELARAVAGRYREEDNLPSGEMLLEPDDFSLVRSDHENSPPASPSKSTVRHGALETETLKSSLQHAHRMIQNLKSNIHREKTEKFELKRMLQESKDELDMKKSESNGQSNGNRRQKQRAQVDISKKGARSSALGTGRNSKVDIEVDDHDWEEHISDGTPSKATISEGLSATSHGLPSKLGDVSDAYQTANETDDAFETANERDAPTENEASHTGNEGLAGESSDELTETEEGVARSSTIRGKQGHSLHAGKPGQRSSYISTASTSASDEENETKTPVHTLPQKYRLKVNRGSRRSRIGSEGLPSSGPSSMKNSPASFVSMNGQNDQSLFAELGELNGEVSGDEPDGTPSRTSMSSQRSTPAPRSISAKQSLPQPTVPYVPRLPMVDSSMMTEPLETPQSDSAASGQHLDVTPATPLTKGAGVQRTPTISPQQATASTSTSTTPRMAWDQPLQHFVGSIPTFWPTMTATTTPTKSITTQGGHDSESPHGETKLSPATERQSDLLAATATSQPPLAAETPSLPTLLSFSDIQSLETQPAEPIPAIPSRDTRRIMAAEEPKALPAQAPKEEQNETDRGGVLGSVLGWARTRRQSTPHAVDNESNQEVEKQQPTSQIGRTPFKEVPANIMQRESTRGFAGDVKKPTMATMADQSSQTVLSAEQIDNALSSKVAKPLASATGNSQRSPPIMMKPLSDIGAALPQPSNDIVQSSSRPTTREAPLSRLMRRTSSSGSVGNLRLATLSMPPLPPDHQQAIAAAAQRTSSSHGTATIMGPPLAQASSYRPASNIPRTPSEARLQSPSTKNSATPRARYSTARSQMSRRSSVTSFASELDARFNIRTSGMPMLPGMESGADPRMIQAITQTMIGEYLWKYTRKAGREDMSSNRHRRFFWIHPYTRTLYWSDQDPSMAGRAQLKAKSVAIEGVRVVTDDNPMPPGLHRKSLIILTPGRAVKLTASTGQRHETWFNSLSYLILRTGQDPARHADDNGLTAEDVAEFNPGGSSRNRTSRTGHSSRVSLSSHNSRQNVPNSRTSSRNGSQDRGQSAMSTRERGMSTNSRQSQIQHGSMASRFSSYWRPARSSVLGSMSSRHSVQPEGAVYDSTAAHDSAEDLRQVIAKQEEESDRLENVRACCDGKHDVGSLTKRESAIRRKLTDIVTSPSNEVTALMVLDQRDREDCPFPLCNVLK